MKKIINRKSLVISPGLPCLTTLVLVMKGLYVLIFLCALSSCNAPKEQIVLREIKEVVVDASSSPKLKGRAIFYNPNDVRMRLKKIDVEIFVEGKKVGNVNQELKLIIPANDEFTIDIEVLLAMKELSFMDTLFGVIAGKKFQVEYKSFLKLTYHGLPIKVPVNYKDEIRLKF